MTHPLTAPSDRPLVIGHRGAMAMAPENTLASFREAFRQGADGVECDVHLTRDGQVVVMHDFTLDRTSTGKGAIADHTLADLAGLDAGSWYDPRFAGEPVPTLGDFLSLVARAPRRLAVIELKAGSRRYPGMERAVLIDVLRHDLLERTVLISFDHHAILEAKRLEPRLAAGVLYYAQPVAAPDLARAAGADALGPSLELVTAEEVAAAHAAGLKVFVWTAQVPDHARHLARIGVDAFGANAPGEAIAALIRP